MVDRVYALRQWPRKIHIEQDGPSPMHCTIRDADTCAVLDTVFSLSVSREASYIEMTMAAHEPIKPSILATADEAELYEVEQGVLVERRRYLITSMQITAEG